MKKHNTIIKENELFTNQIRINDNAIKELNEKLGLCFSNFKDYAKKYEETKEERKKIQAKINELKYINEYLTLASNYKASDLQNNLYIALLSGLKELKILNKNLTDLRKEKIKNYLIENNYIDSENHVSIYKDSSDYINCSVTGKRASYKEGIEIYFHPERTDYIEKMEFKKIEKDQYYIEVAKNFIDKINTIQNELKEFNSKINDKLQALESENDLYSTKYIYQNACINLYK